MISHDAVIGPQAEIAERGGLRPILELSRRRVLAGETTVDEIERAVGSY